MDFLLRKVTVNAFINDLYSEIIKHECKYYENHSLINIKTSSPDFIIVLVEYFSKNFYKQLPINDSGKITEWNIFHMNLYSLFKE